MHFTCPFQNPSPLCRIPSKIIEPIRRWDIEYVEQAPVPLPPPPPPPSPKNLKGFLLENKKQRKSKNQLYK